MLEKGRISSRQFILLLVTTVVATAILILPAIVAKNARQDGWISILVVATIHGAIVAIIIAALARRFPTQTLVEYSESILGRWLGKIAGFLMIIWFIYTNAIVVREFAEFMITAFMPETPLLVINGLILILAASTVRNGLETIARVNIYYISGALTALLIVNILLTKDMAPAAILPVLEQGWKPVILGGATPSAFRGELVLGAMMMPYINQRTAGRHAPHWANLLIALLLTSDFLSVLFILGPLTAESSFPTLAIARYVSAANFLERFEVLVMLIWIAGVMVKIAIFYYAAVLGTAQLCGLRDYRPLVFPAGIILLVLAIVSFDNFTELSGFIDNLWPVYALVFETVLPLTLLLVAVILGKREGQKP